MAKQTLSRSVWFVVGVALGRRQFGSEQTVAGTAHTVVIPSPDWNEPK
jgi:hypothetical protein